MAMQTRRMRQDRRHGWLHLLGQTVLLGSLILVWTTSVTAENWFEKGLADLKAKDYPAAVDKFTMAIEAVPNDFEALNNRGFARIYTGDYEGAIEDCTRSIDINPGSAKAYNNRGFARLFTGAYDDAITDFNKALSINPRYVDAYSNRCLAWTRKEDYTRAIADATEALHLNPRSAKALYNRGYARDRQGDPGGAMGDYIQALEVNPDYIEVFNNMAWIMATSPDERLRDGRRAVTYAEKAVGSTPDINFLDTLAAAYAESGRFDEAIAIENRIISLLASARQTDQIAMHVKRMNLYEEGRPYREPIAIHSVSAVTDLQGALETLDQRVLTPEITTPAAFDAKEVAPGLAAPADEAPQRILTAQSDPAPAPSLPEAYNQSLQTSPGFPVEINLAAEPEADPSITFEIETVPYHGALQGTLPHLLYTPRPGFTGMDRFTFRARNAVGLSNLATVTITVAMPPANEAEAEPTAATVAAPDVKASPEPQAEPGPDAAASEPETAEAPVPDATSSPGVAETQPKPEPEAPSPATAEKPPEMPATPPAEKTPEKTSRPETAATAGARPTPVETEIPATAPQPMVNRPAAAAYTIQVRSVKSASDAARIVAQLREEGYSAFSHAVDVPDKGQWHRVFINGYPSVAAAKEAIGKLDPERFKGAYVQRIPAGAALPPVPAAAPPAIAPAAPETVIPPENTPPAEPEANTGDERQAIDVDGRYPYAYQVKSYQQKEDAFQLGVELTTQGHTAFIGRGTMGSTGVWYRVYIGCYASPEEAEKNRTDIARNGFPEAFLTPIGYAIAVKPDASDPAGEQLENRLIASGFLPYRLPQTGETASAAILVGGFRHADDATQVLAALAQSGFKGELRPR